MWAVIDFEKIKEEEGGLKQNEFRRKRKTIGGELLQTNIRRSRSQVKSNKAHNYFSGHSRTSNIFGEPLKTRPAGKPQNRLHITVQGKSHERHSGTKIRKFRNRQGKIINICVFGRAIHETQTKTFLELILFLFY